MEKELIAPCGMNCAICSGYLAMKYDVKSKGLKMTYCSGCRPRDKQCAFLKKRCKLLLNDRVEYCQQCPDYPCRNLEHIDGRYRRLYHMSMLENLALIGEKGVEGLLVAEMEKWRCPDCGEGTVCCHNGICFNCGLEKLNNKKKFYRWEDD